MLWKFEVFAVVLPPTWACMRSTRRTNPAFPPFRRCSLHTHIANIIILLYYKNNIKNNAEGGRTALVALVGHVEGGQYALLRAVVGVGSDGLHVLVAHALHAGHDPARCRQQTRNVSYGPVQSIPQEFLWSTTVQHLVETTFCTRISSRALMASGDFCCTTFPCPSAPWLSTPPTPSYHIILTN
jgi:hypothetical protein